MNIREKITSVFTSGSLDGLITFLSIGILAGLFLAFLLWLI